MGGMGGWGLTCAGHTAGSSVRVCIAMLLMMAAHVTNLAADMKIKNLIVMLLVENFDHLPTVSAS